MPAVGQAARGPDLQDRHAAGTTPQASPCETAIVALRLHPSSNAPHDRAASPAWLGTIQQALDHMKGSATGKASGRRQHAGAEQRPLRQRTQHKNTCTRSRELEPRPPDEHIRADPRPPCRPCSRTFGWTPGWTSGQRSFSQRPDQWAAIDEERGTGKRKERERGSKLGGAEAGQQGRPRMHFGQAG